MRKLILVSILLAGVTLIFLSYFFWRKPQLIPSESTPTVSTTLLTEGEKPKVTLIGKYEIPISKIMLFCGKYLCVGGEAGLKIVDVSEPSHPTIVGSYRVLQAGKRFGGVWEAPKGFYFQGDYLYIAVPSGIEIANISEPTKPKIAGGYITQTVEQPGPTGLRVSGNNNHLFLGTDFGLLIFDVSDPTKPVLIGGWNRNFYVGDIYVISNNYIYLTGHIKNDPSALDYLYVLNISDKTNPVLAKKFGVKETIPLPAAIYVTNKTAYVLSKFPKRAISIFDVSDPSHPILTGEYEVESINSVNLSISGEYLYTTSKDGLLIFDISNPKKTALVSKIPGNFGLISGSGNYIYSLINSPTKYLSSELQIFQLE